MIAVPVTTHSSAEPAAYVTPVLTRFGSATELTKTRTMAGAMDGGSNVTRSQ